MDEFIKTNIKIAFLLDGNISILGRYVEHLRNYNKLVYVHLDKIQGISHDVEGLKFVARFINPTGIITTKSNMIVKAKKFNLSTIQRLFLVDSDAVKYGMDSIEKTNPDAVEVMPGIIPSMVSKLKQQTDIPIVTGGLISEPSEMRIALEHGASAVSTSNPKLWKKQYIEMMGSEKR